VKPLLALLTGFTNLAVASQPLNLDYLLSADLAPFTKESVPSLNGESILKTQQLWQISYEYEELLSILQGAKQAAGRGASSECVVLEKTASALVDLAKSAKENFYSKCIFKNQGADCVSELQRTKVALEPAKTLLISAQRGCRKSRVDDVVPLIQFDWLPQKDHTLLQAESGFSSESVIAAASPTASRRKGLLVGLTLDDQRVWSDQSLESAVKLNVLESVPLYDVSTFYHVVKSAEEFSFVGKARYEASSALRTESRSDPQLLQRISGSLGLVSGDRQDKDFFAINYLPILSLSTGGLYSAKEHGVEFLFGKFDESVLRKSAFFVRFQKSLAGSNSISASWQQVLLGYRVIQSLPGAANYKAEVAALEFRDSSGMVRFYPYLDLSLKSQSLIGPVSGAPFPLAKWYRQGELNLFTGIRPSFRSAMTSEMRLTAAFHLLYLDDFKVSIFGRLAHLNAQSVQPAGPQKWIEFESSLTPSYRFAKDYFLYATLGLKTSVLGEVPLAPHSTAWINANQSSLKSWATLGISYEF
jgi:hypothetical protein